jgi:hypothetical protein
LGVKGSYIVQVEIVPEVLALEFERFGRVDTFPLVIDGG